MAEKKKIVSGELVYIFPWRFYENCEIDIHEEKNSILIIVRLGNCFQKGNDNGRNYQADYVYFLLRLINLYHQSASPMHRTQNANAYFRFQTIRKNKWNGASLPRFENETQRFSSLCLLFICKAYHTRHVFSSVKELGRSEERQ